MSYAYIRILGMLPATPLEVAVMLPCTPRQAHAWLCYLRKGNLAKKTDRSVDNGTTGRGKKRSHIWSAA